MRTIQQSIEVEVAAATLYRQLTQFEQYPRFMEEVDAVRQLDATRLRWVTRIGNRPVEWDARITEQQPDQRIVWRALAGPARIGRVDVQALGPQRSQVIFTLESAPSPGAPAADSAAAIAQRLKKNLLRLKELVELDQDELDRVAPDRVALDHVALDLDPLPGGPAFASRGGFSPIDRPRPQAG